MFVKYDLVVAKFYLLLAKYARGTEGVRGGGVGIRAVSMKGAGLKKVGSCINAVRRGVKSALDFRVTKGVASVHMSRNSEIDGNRLLTAVGPAAIGRTRQTALAALGRTRSTCEEFLPLRRSKAVSSVG